LLSIVRIGGTARDALRRRWTVFQKADSGWRGLDAPLSICRPLSLDDACNYPDMSLADARVEAREKRTMLDKQRDPLLEKQAAVEQQRAVIVAQKARAPSASWRKTGTTRKSTVSV